MFSKRSILISAIILASLFIFFLSINFARASVTAGNPFFNLSQSGFGPGQTIEGTLNFSLLNEPGSTLLRATMNCGNVVKNMSLLDFLKKANAQITCNPQDCNVTYTASASSLNKTMNLGPGAEAYYGIVAFGGNVQVQNLSFAMNGSSSAQPVCYETPFKFDLLNDGTVDFEYKEVQGYCSQHASSCFDINYASQSGSVENTPACQKIWLNKTGAVNVTVLLSRIGDAGTDRIEMFVYDLNGNVKSNCSLDGWEVDENFGYFGCVVGLDEAGEPTGFYIDKAGDYFVCVRKSFGSSAQYLIKKEAQGTVCGFYNNPPSTIFTEDYAIYVAEGMFAPFNNETTFNESTMIGGVTLASYIQNYITTKYNNNCSGNGCVIPLKFISLANQQVTLKDLFFKYSPNIGATPTTEYNFYNLSVVQPQINATNQTLAFSVLNLTAPQQSGQQCAVSVQLGPASGSRQFTVAAVPTIFNVFPLAVIPNEATMFRAVASAPAGKNIVSYVWNWGDMRTEQTTLEPNASHTYTQIGNYILTVKATDNTSMTGSKSFTITSNITKELLNNTINTLLARIDVISAQYNAIELWYRDMIELNLTTINATLQSYKAQLPTATPSQLITIKQGLDVIDVPLNITDSLRLMESVYYPNLENIEPQYIETVAGSAYDENQKEQYQNAIAAWQQENLDLRISGAIKTLVYDANSEDKVTVVNIRLDPLASSLGTVYLIFSLPPGVSYSNVKWQQGNFDVHDLSDAIGFEFSDMSASETISLALPGKHDFASLMFYASPKLEEVGVGVTPPPGKEKGAPWGLAIFFIILILLIAAAVLWFLWRGYSEKLEKKLFKNKSDLYNIMSFITNAEAKGAKKEEINEQLLKAGWKKEQISYAWGKLKKQKAQEEKKAKQAKGKGKTATAAKSEELGLSPYGTGAYSIYRR